MQKIEYIVIMCETVAHMERAVIEYIRNGWEPTGGVAEIRGLPCQAMIRKTSQTTSQSLKQQDDGGRG